MAQAGLYVPGMLTYKPFSKIITRLSGEDDLVSGKSSFIVEMTEIRTILRNADQNTLVLGDEPCRGTNTQEGTGIAVAIIEETINRDVKFIFSTHMHHLPKIKLINQYRNENVLCIAHLTAVYDDILDRLVYTRRLEEGPGSSQYAFEVCKSLNIDRSFIERANKIRQELDDIPDLFHNTKKSRYNSKIYVDQCALCHSHINLHSHHIKEQSKADSQDFIGYYHKNSSFNLLILCENCHIQLHSDKNRLIQKQTLNGVYLVPEKEKTLYVDNITESIEKRLVLSTN